MVVNGATQFGDMAHFKKQMEIFDGDVTMEYLEDRGHDAASSDSGSGSRRGNGERIRQQEGKQ